MKNEKGPSPLPIPGVPGRGGKTRCNRRIGVALFLLVVGSSTAPLLAQADAPPGTDAPPAIAPLDGNSSVDAILDDLKQRGVALKNFTADVNVTDTDTSTQLSTSNAGHVVFENQPGGGGRIRVTFVSRTVNGMTQADKHEYILDGQWLIELDYKNTKFIKRQVLAPGQKLDLLKLGEGPFPLPIGQDKSDVYSQFDVKKIAAADGDPPNTVHLELTPKAGTQFARKFQTIDVYVDTKTAMPVRIDTLDPSGVQRTTELTKIKVNVDLPKGTFDIPPETKDWSQVEEPYEGN
jgi:outer membrane lipoprotein-sorting protein